MKDLQKPYSKTPPLNTLRYPVLAMPKLDGIRCAMENHAARTYNKKPVPNIWINEILGTFIDLIEGFDGELTICDGGFDSVQSGVMSQDGMPNFRFVVFDIHNLNLPFKQRVELVHKRVADLRNTGYVESLVFEAVEVKLCRNEMELQLYWDECIALGYEGCVANSPDGYYKNGRSGLREQLSIKLKKWFDAEATIVGFEEEVAADGTLKGRVGRVTMLADNGVEFGAGGLTDALKKDMWDNPNKYLCKRATYKYQEETKDGAPRFPSYKGVRHD